MNKVIVITGPTGVGKTKFSIELAKALNTEIINEYSEKNTVHENIKAIYLTRLGGRNQG